MGPKAMWQLGVGLFLALTLAGLIGLSEHAGAEAPVMVVLTTSEQAYRIGATAQVELHIFKGEAPVNADDVTLEVGPWGEVREVEMTRASTGLYRATFTILEQDVEQPGYQIPIEVQAVVSGDSYARYLSPAIRTPERISLSFQPQQPLPADEVTITLRGLKEEKPVEVQDLELKVREGNLGSSTPLSLEELTRGVYRASFQVPAELKQTTFYLVEASGKVNNRDLEERRGLPVVLHHLWSREVVMTETLAMLDLWVLDAAGTPVEAAQVRGNLTINEWEANEQVVALETLTDSNGVARLTAGYSQGRTLDLEVQVSQGDLTTEFDYSTTIGDALFTYGLELDTEEVDELRPGQQAKATLRLWSEGEPLGDSDLFYTLASDTVFITSGRRTTNQEGRFELLFTVPDDLRDQLELKVYPAQAQGAYSSSASTYLPPVFGSDLGLKATGFTPGGWAQITSQPNNRIEEAYLSVVSIDPQLESSPWVYQGMAYFGNALLVQGSQDLKARLPIPDGFSAEQGYMITAFGVQGGALSAEMVTVNLPDGDRPGSGGSGGLLKLFQSEFGGLPLWLWLGFGAGGFATVFGIVTTKRRRKNRPVKDRPASTAPPPTSPPPDRPAEPSLGGVEAEAPSAASLPPPAPAPAPLPQAPPGLTPQPKPPAVPPLPPGASPHPPPANKGQVPSQRGLPPPPPPHPPPPQTPLPRKAGPQRVTIECPQCRAHMEVPKLNRPQKVRCGACGLEGRAEI